jgi:GT2 family glycosyltransferase
MDVPARLELEMRERVSRCVVVNEDVAADASVVIVTYRTPAEVFEPVLEALDDQTASNYEIVVVANGTDADVESTVEGSEHVRLFVELDRNYGVTVGRNLGAKLARGDLLLFLDDDGVPERDFVAAHRRAHAEHDIVAARGRVLPKHDTVYTRIQSHYDLGDEPFPYFINVEGNTSFDRETYLDAGGYDENLADRAGHEGIELTHRLMQAGYRRDQIIYYPDAVIYHDYANSFVEYIRKRTGRNPNLEYLFEHRPEIFEFAASYDPPVTSPELRTRDKVKFLALSGVRRVVDFVM